MASKNVSFLLSLLTTFSLFTSAPLSSMTKSPQLLMTRTLYQPQTASPQLQTTTSYRLETELLGEWVLLQKSMGISAMHMQLLHNNKVVIFDRTDFGISNLSLPANATCRRNDAVVKLDCSAHSLLYPNGALVQTGGYRAGDRKIRLFTPCADPQNCDWVELPENLAVRRWYASNHILPDGRVIVVGSRRQFNYEFFPRRTSNGSLSEIYQLPFLQNTTDRFEENNLYPFLHLLPDGNLYIFANRRSISFDYVRNQVVWEFPEIPGEKRNYPSSGSSVLLPLRGQSPAAEVMICGGASNLAYFKADNQRVYMEASTACGRLKVTEPEPEWAIEDMPMGRVMSDMILLPSGDVVIINGASNGTAGWEDAVGPVLNPVIYFPTQPDSTRRSVVLNPSKIPRMYHSAATLLPDGRILVGGINPHMTYNFTAV